MTGNSNNNNHKTILPLHSHIKHILKVKNAITPFLQLVEPNTASTNFTTRYQNVRHRREHNLRTLQQRLFIQNRRFHTSRQNSLLRTIQMSPARPQRLLATMVPKFRREVRKPSPRSPHRSLLLRICDPVPHGFNKM